MRSPLRCAAIVAALLLVGGGAAAEEPLGIKPGYTDRALSLIPNAQAIDRRIWSPGLDEGYVPQGLTFQHGALYVATYMSTDPKQGRGPCRLYRLDPTSGAVTGMLDLPPACGHAGGLARGPAGRLFVADTRIVFEVTIAKPAMVSIGKVVREMKLEGDVRGSFAAGSADALWLGTYAKDGTPKLYRFPFGRLESRLDRSMAAAVVPMPLKAQGAAFDTNGKLWITRSGATFGELLRLDPASGAIEQRFAMPAGIEDISFDATGHLWAVSEAGTRRWLGWETFYPVVFRLDLLKLE